MPLDPSVPTGREAIRVAVDEIRRSAWNAASNADNDILCCWQPVMIVGHEHVEATRVSPDGTEFETIAMSPMPGVAEYIAKLHPNAGLQVAQLLETLSREAKNVPDEVLRRAVDVAQSIITDHGGIGDCAGEDCPGWHHIMEFPKKENKE